MAKKSKSEPTPKETKKPKPSKKEVAPTKKEVAPSKKETKKPLTEKQQRNLVERKKVWAVKLLEKLVRHTKREFKKQNIVKDEKETLEFVKTIVLPVFRGLNPRDVRVKDIREVVADSFVTTTPSIYYNPLFIPIGDITGIM